MDIQIIEYIILFVIALFQIGISYFLSKRIKDYRNIFKSKYELQDRIISLEAVDEKVKEEEKEEKSKSTCLIIETDSNSSIFKNLIKVINHYLIKNKRAIVDFHILKDITDRAINTKEEEIQNRIPAPLYLGLAATMVGIIVGLWGVDANKELGTDTIAPLINGIKWAMSASVFGLILTTVFSIKVFNDAKIQVEEDKDEFLSFLQTELLPDLYKSEETGVRALTHKIDYFGKTATVIVEDLGDVVTKTSKSIENERQLLEQLNRLPVQQMTSANVKIFKEVSSLMDTFQAFPNYYAELTSSLSNTTELANRLGEFVSKTDNVNRILDEIRSSIEATNKATAFFNKHIRSFVEYENSVNEAVANADSAMRLAIGNLEKAIKKQFDSYRDIVTDYSSQLDKSFNTSIKKYVEAADQQLERINNAFDQARPRFEKLEKLDLLEKLSELEKLEKLNDLGDIKSLLKELIQKYNLQTETIRNLQIRVDGESIDFPKSLLLKTPKSKFDKVFKIVSFTAYVSFILMAIILLIGSIV